MDKNGQGIAGHRYFCRLVPKTLGERFDFLWCHLAGHGGNLSLPFQREPVDRFLIRCLGPELSGWDIALCSLLSQRWERPFIVSDPATVRRPATPSAFA